MKLEVVTIDTIKDSDDITLALRRYHESLKAQRLLDRKMVKSFYDRVDNFKRKQDAEWVKKQELVNRNTKLRNYIAVKGLSSFREMFCTTEEKKMIVVGCRISGCLNKRTYKFFCTKHFRKDKTSRGLTVRSLERQREYYLKNRDRIALKYKEYYAKRKRLVIING